MPVPGFYSEGKSSSGSGVATWLPWLLVGLLAGGIGGYLLGMGSNTAKPPGSLDALGIEKSSLPGEKQQNPLPKSLPEYNIYNPLTNKAQPQIPGPKLTDTRTTEIEGIRHLDLSVSGSLYKTLSKKVAGREADVLSAHVGRVLSWKLNLRKDVQKNDKLFIIYRPAENPINLQILALSYISTDLGRKISAYFYKKQGARYGRYYYADGTEVEKRLENPPLDDYEQITELMNLAGRKHRGVDFKVDEGSPVKTPFKAVVMRRNWSTRRNGNCLNIKYVDSGIQAFFLHLDKIENSVKPGTKIPAGTVIAYSGNTGRSTAPHLHYELHSKNGRLLNPFDVHKTKQIKLSHPDLQGFLKTKSSLDKIINESYPESSPVPSASTASKAKPE